MSPVTIIVDGTRQQLILKSADHFAPRYPVSTSRFGFGEEEGTHQTPRGKHRICEKIGAGEPIGTIFKGRQLTGRIWSPDDPPVPDDLILSRILWLEGLEPRNCNSKERYIYLHGTNQENLIGQPASIGCIRLTNADIVDLFDKVEIGTEVLIHE